MQVYEGQYLELGPSKDKGAGRDYMYIKIDDHVVKNISVTNGIDAILHGELKRSGVTTLFMKKILFKNRLVAISSADGQVYKMGKYGLACAGYFGMLFFGLLGISMGGGMFGWTLIVVWLLFAPFLVPILLGLRCLLSIKADYKV